MAVKRQQGAYEVENNSENNQSSSKITELHHFIDALVSNFAETELVKRGKKRSLNAGQIDLPGRNLDLYKNWLTKAHQLFRDASQHAMALTYASEWVLDNYYVIKQALQQIEEDLPASFYRQLPLLIKTRYEGHPRIYEIAKAILEYQNILVDPIEIQNILQKFQEKKSLTTGELWAVPIFLRYGLIERLAHALVFAIRPENSPILPAITLGLIDSKEMESIDEPVLDEYVNNNIISNVILSLRTIAELDWKEFFEAVSCLEKTLQNDPAGVYPKMDFKTRDSYRKEIEKLAYLTGRDECELAQIAIDLARSKVGKSAANSDSDNKPSVPEAFSFTTNANGKNILNPDPNFINKEIHIGEYLLGKNRSELEHAINNKQGDKFDRKRWGQRHASTFYTSVILLLTLLILVSLSFATQVPGLMGLPFPPVSQPIEDARLIWNETFLTIIGVLIFLALSISSFTIATSLINWLITQRVRPFILPKLDFKLGIPTSYQTLVVIPSLITSREEIDSLTQQIELHYLRNPEPGLKFALLTDFKDADKEKLPEDEELVSYSIDAVRSLNEKYPVNLKNGELKGQGNSRQRKKNPSASDNRFYFLHRKRLWNPSERKWIGWERKRGKLHELNLLLRGESNLTFSTIYPGTDADLRTLHQVRFVLTLDSDTILPRGAACRLAGTLAHPLNRSVVDPKTGQTVSGYTVLQPRMEIHPRSANHSLFTRIYSGDTGLDLYTLAVSDTYQDLFGEGSYVGKGIYDVDAFEFSVDEHIPENSVLSHDLLEGIMGRAGLTTDITMIEDFPQNYLIQAMRQRRWMRGDWQLLPWLFKPRKFGLIFSLIARWKIFDNMRRALLAPALLLIFIFGLVFIPGLAAAWTGIVLLSLAMPFLTTVTSSVTQLLNRKDPGRSLRPIGYNFARWLVAIIFLPYEAYISVDALFTTLYRLYISHKNLLQWTTAAQTTHLFGLHSRRGDAWQKIVAETIFTVAFGAVIQVLFNLSRSGLALTTLSASPVLVFWLVSPIIAWWINRPIVDKPESINIEHIDLLRRLTRRTWGFFERFVGPEDHWLPPDHYQESPGKVIAHQTSPTNIGLLLTSTLAAYDLGYLDQLGLATRLITTIESLDLLERYRGHFLNWYDTQTLKPLRPRYVSTVDSGNLAAALIVTAQACRTLPDEPAFRWELWEGYLDTVSNLSDILSGKLKAGFTAQVLEINHRIDEIHAEILSVKEKPERWYKLFLKVNGPFWRDLSQRLMDLIEVGRTAFDLETLEKLQEVTAQIERHHGAVQRTINELLPWIPLFENSPVIEHSPEYLELRLSLRRHLSFNLALSQVHPHIQEALPIIELLRKSLGKDIKLSGDTGGETDQIKDEIISWLDSLEDLLNKADSNSGLLLRRYEEIVSRSEQFINEMNFTFLYEQKRRVFHLGFNLDAGQLDRNYYDLLASEARIASIVAIAKGDVPQSHWLQMSRPVTKIDGLNVLLSWSGTMFEYLMPPLFLRSYPGTLLFDSAIGAVKNQIAYGKSKGVPWGISESGFYRLDSNQNFQYRAFGVPKLGFKRGLSDDLVIAPYASLMAINYAPREVANNLDEIIKHQMFGIYGVYEAIDFTTERLILGQHSEVISEYMTHHQGMILMAIANYLADGIMVKRMHSDPRIQSVELLLQEQSMSMSTSQDNEVEYVKGVQRKTTNLEQVSSWQLPINTPIPQVHLLSNRNYSVLLSNMGGGYSSWRDVDLTRWQSDGVLDPWGSWIYIQDMESDQKLWSVGNQPIPGNIDEMQVTYFAHMAVFQRSENGIVSTMELTVAPEDPLEIRRVHLQNNKHTTGHIRLTSYGEVILNSQATDTRHPAFNKLFIESEFIPHLNLQIFKRRPRSDKESAIYMGHMLVMKGSQVSARHEADRRQFIGRGRSLRDPNALSSEEYLTGTPSATLDPIFSLGIPITINSNEYADVAFITLAAENRQALLELASRYQSWSLIDHTFHQADISAQTWLGKQEISSQSFQDNLQLLSALVYPFKEVRTSPETISANQLGQPGLWRFGISGDYPVLLVEIENPKQVELIREAIVLYKFLRSRHFKIDLVILNCQQSNYGAEINGMLYRLVSKLCAEDRLNQRGGIFVLYRDQMEPEERTLLHTSARVILDGAKGSLGDQLPGYSIPVHHLPEFMPTRQLESEEQSSQSNLANWLKVDTSLTFFNGYGGFNNDGKEYLIDLPAGVTTPAPWVNVIGYPEFGFLVSESGSQCTWAINSGENRLTPWSNDPVRDPSGEILYMRDEETGEVWTPTPLPTGGDSHFQVTHGAGYSLFEHESHGFHQLLTLFASPEDPVKIIHLKIENKLDRTRRVTATQYVEWVLGTTQSANKAYLIPEYDSDAECFLASNPFNTEFSERVAFLFASKAVHGLTADRTEFLGRGGSYALPAALKRLGLESRITAGEDPCAAMQLHLDLLPGATEEVYFVIGQGRDKNQALALAKKYHRPAYVGEAFEKTRIFWDNLLGKVQVNTPQPATDIILNRWMLYQTLSCRIWGRTGFYQSSGAFGFRDQLQDVLALLPIDPGITRSQILNAARHQFEEGDVLHWWHPPSDRGVRTHFSDDLLWLPFVTAKYLDATGDIGLLNEQVPYLAAPPLLIGEEERYAEFAISEHPGTLLDHCLRAIEKGSTIGTHGLPLIGTGDWNDGFNRVGEKGLGESIWLAWFLYDVLERFAVIVENQGDDETAASYRSKAKDYAAAVEQSGWDGDWYRRGYFDNGIPFGTAQDLECQIDSIAQSWSVLSGAADPDRAKRAMESVVDRLVHPKDRLSLLFTPPFDKTLHSPGYVKGYVPGIRENGGQYSHAATWTAWAFAKLGNGKQAGSLFDLLNPIFQSNTKQMADQYRVEPYVICADIYSVAPYVRRGGWTWYTGSSAWMYQLGLEAILGIKKNGDNLLINPCIPPEWDGYDVRYIHGWFNLLNPGEKSKSRFPGNKITET